MTKSKTAKATSSTDERKKQHENETASRKFDLSKNNQKILHKTATACNSIKKPKVTAKKPQQVQTTLKKVS